MKDVCVADVMLYKVLGDLHENEPENSANFHITVNSVGYLNLSSCSSSGKQKYAE